LKSLNIPFSVVSQLRFSRFCDALVDGKEEVSVDSAIAWFNSISPTLILRRLIWFGRVVKLLSVSSTELLGNRVLICKGDC
jgi:hypothetical protein